MANITLGTLRDYWKGVYDWVVNGSYIPKLHLTDGSGNSLIDSYGNLKVSQQGKLLQTAISRNVKSASTAIWLDVPEFANNAIVILKVYSVTGTFNTGEGINLETRTSFEESAASTPIKCVSEKATNPLTRQAHIWGVGLSKQDSTNPADVYAASKIVSVPPFDKLYVLLDITGTFNAGEGFDCEVKVLWKK